MGATGYVYASIFVIIFSYLWRKSHVFRYYVKIVYYNAVMVVVSGLFVLTYAPFRPKDVRNLRPVAYLYNMAFSIFGIDYELRNGHYMKSDKPMVIVSNHQSSLDVIAMMRFLPDRFSALAKKELLYAGFFGLGAWLCGIVFVDRLNKERARGTMNNTAKILNERNIKLWIFPEGTRNRGGKMLPFKKGAFHLAKEAEVPVVPVVISTYSTFYDKKKNIFETGKVIVEVLPPVEVTKDTDVTELAEKLRDQMMEKFDVLSEEALSCQPPLDSRI